MAARTRRGLATWITNSATPIFLLDDRRVVLVFNRGCELLTQWDRADLIGKTAVRQSPAPTDSIEAILSVISPPESVLEGNPAWLPIVCPKKDGTVSEQTVHFFALPDEKESRKRRILGLIGPPLSEPPRLPTRQFSTARHAAKLYQKYSLNRFVAVSAAMQRVAAQIAVARQCDESVFIQGERGCGKEHIARLIHYGSQRRSQRFIPIDCETATHFEVHRLLQRLIEDSSENDEQGGTVFLKNIDRLSRDQQETVLEMASGASIRWMSTSIVALTELSEKQLSSDLRCRLTTIPVTAPPLRERLDDLLILAQQFVDSTNQPHQPQREGLATEVERAMLEYHWPGNVDELEQVVLTACRKRPQGLIELNDLPWEFQAGKDAQTTRPAPQPINLEERLAEYERQLILGVLDSVRGNRTAAAGLLGIPRARFYRRLESLGLTETDGIEVEEPDH